MTIAQAIKTNSAKLINNESTFFISKGGRKAPLTEKQFNTLKESTRETIT